MVVAKGLPGGGGNRECWMGTASPGKVLQMKGGGWLHSDVNVRNTELYTLKRLQQWIVCILPVEKSRQDGRKRVSVFLDTLQDLAQRKKRCSCSYVFKQSCLQNSPHALKPLVTLAHSSPLPRQPLTSLGRYQSQWVLALPNLPKISGVSDHMRN